MLACSVLIESSSKLLVTRTCEKALGELIAGTFRLLAVEFLDPEPTPPKNTKKNNNKKQLLSYLKTIQNILMTLLAGSQVSNRFPLGYLLL